MIVRVWHVGLLSGLLVIATAIILANFIDKRFILLIFSTFFIFVPAGAWGHTAIFRFGNLGKYCLKECDEIGLSGLAQKIGLITGGNGREYYLDEIAIEGNKLTTPGGSQFFVMEKHPNFNMYKVIGVHHTDAEQDSVYLIGKDAHTGTPYILRSPPRYIRKPLMECLRWNIGMTNRDKLTEV